MKIKRFDESNHSYSSLSGDNSIYKTIYLVSIPNPAAMHLDELFQWAFESEVQAYDHLIKWTNQNFALKGDKKFEPFFDDEGFRLFTDMYENEDFDNCLTFLEENNWRCTVDEIRLMKLSPFKGYN